jgi:hypothetical protein
MCICVCVCVCVCVIRDEQYKEHLVQAFGIKCVVPAGALCSTCLCCVWCLLDLLF